MSPIVTNTPFVIYLEITEITTRTNDDGSIHTISSGSIRDRFGKVV